MKSHFSMGILVTLALFIVAFSNQQDKKAEEGRKLNQALEDYFEELIQLFPIYATYMGDNRYDDKLANDISEEHRMEQRRLFTSYLDKISKMDRDLLEGQDRLSYDIFKREMKLNLEELQFYDHLIPINQLFSTPSFFARLGSGSSLHPFKSVKDYENFLKRSEDFQEWVDAAISNMRKGVEKGIVRPKILIEKAIPQFEALIVEDIRESIFYRPVENFPDGFEEEDRTRLSEAYSIAIEKEIIPTYGKLARFLKEEYLANCRTTIGHSELPDGRKWYAFKVKQMTTTNLTPDEIFDIGMSEVKRIRKEMEAVKEQVGFKGSLKEFFQHLKTDPRFYFTREEDLLGGYVEIRKRVTPELSRLFALLPEADYEIRPVEDFRAKSAPGAQYMGASPDGTRPGIFYVNTYDLTARAKYSMESLFLHEATPGHHFQISVQQEQEDLPKFRRFGGYTAYIEGWALYAEGLGEELGMYKDPYQYFGKLVAEIWRACRLVVDAGMHAKGWTREEALDFMYENTGGAETRVVAEVERYIAIPGQALAYKIGQLKISELRQKAKETLGEKFAAKTFHDKILKDGALPLDVLEIKIEEWIERQMEDHK